MSGLVSWQAGRPTGTSPESVGQRRPAARPGVCHRRGRWRNRRGASASASLIMLAWLAAGEAALAAERSTGSLANRPLRWPTWGELRSVLLLEDYNTRVVVLGVALLGAAAGLVGSFTLLRKRALLGDALAHASLPGITAAFLLGTALGIDAKSLPLLLAGATVGGLVGVGVILLLQHHTRLKQDATLGIVLSVFFGAGMAMLGVIQQMETGSAAGLETFIYGQTASMRRGDGVLIAITAACAMLGCGLFFKELKLLCFDPDFAGSRGMPVGLFDALLMTLVVLVTIVGLQAVGLVLIVALLVIPAAAARFWTESMAKLAVIAAALGLAGGVLGAGASALFPRLPSGAMIVLVCSLLFAVSMFFGPSRGVLIRLARRRRLDFKIARQHLLRALFEILEPRSSRPQAPAGVARRDELMAERSWSAAQFQRQLRAAVRSGLVREVEGGVTLTERGYAEAARLVRQHRLWELYLIHYAEVATARVDRDADDIEHVLEAEIVARLERLLERESREAGVGARVPPSPHPLRVLGETR